MLDSHRNIAEKLEHSWSLTQVLFETSVKTCIFLSSYEWVSLGGVGVIFNSSSNLIMNLWNLFSQLVTYNITAGWSLPCLFSVKCQHWIFLLWMRMKTNINLSIKLIFQKTLFQLHWSTILRKSKHCVQLSTPLIVPCDKKNNILNDTSLNEAWLFWMKKW